MNNTKNTMKKSICELHKKETCKECQEEGIWTFEETAESSTNRGDETLPDYRNATNTYHCPNCNPRRCPCCGGIVEDTIDWRFRPFGTTYYGTEQIASQNECCATEKVPQGTLTTTSGPIPEVGELRTFKE